MAAEEIGNEEKSDLEKIEEQSSAEAIRRIDKNLQIEKRNRIGKRLLRLLTFQIFLLVADADGKTDTREVAQFKDFLARRKERSSNPYTQRMFHSTVVNYASLTNRYLAGSIQKDFEIVKKAMAYMQSCVSSRIMAEICNDLKGLAVSIAEASGGFLGMTSPISAEEELVLKKLDKIFQMAINGAHGPDRIKPEHLEF